MGVPGNANALLLRSAAAAGGYQVSRSLRFNSSDSAYLSRTPASAGNRKTWTWAGWVKRSALGVRQNIFGTADASFFNGFWAEFFSDDKIRIGDIGPSTLDLELKSTQVFRDCSAWGHLLIAVDTTQATASNRVSAYWNGAKITAFDTASYPTQNFDTRLNTTAAHGIGRAGSYNAQYFSGYLADVHFIDGQSLDPTSFTEVSATTGQLVPKQYSGSFGTNGFWLKFSDNSAATATTLGKDYSGNNNNWSPTNLSVTAGVGNDSLVDTPTSYGTDDSLGGSVRGNYCTLNPLKGGSPTNGNLEQQNSSPINFGTIGVSSGKWYFETVITTQTSGGIKIGVAQQSATGELGDTATAWAILGQSNVNNGQAINNGSLTSSYTTFAQGDVVNCAFDLDSGKIWWGKNGTWLNSGNPAAGTNAIYSNLSGTLFPAATANQGGYLTWNFGQRPFAYTAPSGFKALCDTNLPTPVVAKSASAFDVALYTGTGSNLAVTGLNFSPDLIWTKARSVVDNHILVDQIRGVGNILLSNSTQAESAYSAFVSFDSNGFTKAAAESVNGRTYAAWCWDAGSSTVTNTQGSITSQVRANASAGFSVVSFTGAGGSQTVGHGLGVTPAMIIAKNRATTNSWAVWFTGFTANEYLVLNSTGAKASFSSQWGSTPTSTVFGVADSSVNGSGNGIIAYCFAPVAGYSSFGSYVGNGSATDGPFVYTGFRPRWVMVKNTTLGTASDYWVLFDAARNGYNATEQILYPNFSNAEDTATGNGIDFLSNGFKWRATHTSRNASGSTYIYAAFAESPFQYARAR